MQNTSNLRPRQLPSAKRLILATIAALAVAVVLLLIAVLPAEYGVDPTGLGKKLGLKGLSTHSGAASIAVMSGNSQSADGPVWKQQSVYRTDTLDVELEPEVGVEVKALMQAGERYFFHWEAKGGQVYVDMHGEEPGETKDFTSYWEASGQTADSGYFEAPFEGTHGWYWVNKGETTVTITVTTAGYYAKFYEL